MNVIDFIDNDSIKIKTQPRWFVVLVVFIILTCVLTGYKLRNDLVEAFEWYNVMPSIFMIFFLVIGFALINKRKKYKTILVGFAVTSILFLSVSLLQKQTPISLAKFKDPARYWIENIHCLSIGLIGGSIISLILNIFLFSVLPIPTVKWRNLTSILTGLASILLLSFHCPGPLISHIIVSHWGAALIVFIGQYAISTLFFLWKIRKVY